MKLALTNWNLLTCFRSVKYLKWTGTLSALFYSYRYTAFKGMILLLQSTDFQVQSCSYSEGPECWLNTELIHDAPLAVQYCVPYKMNPWKQMHLYTSSAFELSFQAPPKAKSVDSEAAKHWVLSSTTWSCVAISHSFSVVLLVAKM